MTQYYSSPILLVIFAGIALLIGTLPAQAQDVFVDANATDCGTADGSSSNPYCTIQEAIDNADENNVIEVAEGTYEENITVTESVTLNGPNAGTPGNDARPEDEAVITPAVDDQDEVVIGMAASEVTIDGFTIDGDNPNLSGDYNAAAGVGIDGNQVSADNIIITNTTSCAMVKSSIEGFQGRSRASKCFVGDKAQHVGEQLRNDPRRHAPHRPSTGLFDLKLVFQ